MPPDSVRRARIPTGVFIPRNAPPLFNLTSLEALFWDGRVSRDAQGAFHTPAGAHLTSQMTRSFDFGALSALALFPVLNRAEMRADGGNELALLPDDRPDLIWAALMRRLGGFPSIAGCSSGPIRAGGSTA